MKHVDMRKLPPAAQEECWRQVIGLRQAGQTYDAIAAQVGLIPTGVFDICKRYAERGGRAEDWPAWAQYRSLRVEFCSPKPYGWHQHIENTAFWKVLVAA